MKRAYNIVWDTDDDKELLETLPTEIELPDWIETIDEVSDYISDKTGFCHISFEVEEVSKKID